MKPTNTSESGAANDVTHSMATLSINPSQPSTTIMHSRSGFDVVLDVRSVLSDPEPSTMHTQSSPPRSSTPTTITVIPGTSSSPVGPKRTTTFTHPSETQEAEHFPQPFPGHYKPHRHQPKSQAARNRPCEKYTAASAHHTRNRHYQSLLRMGDNDMDHVLAKHNRNRMKPEHLRQGHRDMIAKLRALKAEMEAIGTFHRGLILRSKLSSLSLTGELKPESVSVETLQEHLPVGIRGGNTSNLVREEALVEGGGGEGDMEDAMEE